MKKFGFVGMGNMAQAMVKGMTQYAGVEKTALFSYAPNQEKLKKNAELLGFFPVDSLEELLKKADTLIMACKPYQIESVLEELQGLSEGGRIAQNIVSVAAGWDFERYAAILGKEARVQYIMPNTPLSVGEGMTLVEDVSGLSSEDREQLISILSGMGKTVELPARLIDAGSAVTGCGPAFVAMVMEGLADGAVKNGIPRDKAYGMVSQMMTGTAKLQLATGLHPGQMKDQVCSPGGTTIKGVAALEDAGMRSAFIKAVDAVVGK